jgi:hypothetical protein
VLGVDSVSSLPVDDLLTAFPTEAPVDADADAELDRIRTKFGDDPLRELPAAVQRQPRSTAT